MDSALNIHWKNEEEHTQAPVEGTAQRKESSGVGNQEISLQGVEETVFSNVGDVDNSREDLIKEYLAQIRVLFENLSKAISKGLLKPSVFVRAMAYVHNINKATFGAIQSRLATKIKIQGKKASKNQQSEVCPICLNCFGNKKIVVLECAHSYHESCLKKWLKYGEHCPLGRCNLK